MKELQIRGSRNADLEDFVDVLKTVRDGNIPIKKLITKEVGMKKQAKLSSFGQRNPAKVSKIIVSFDL